MLMNSRSVLGPVGLTLSRAPGSWPVNYGLVKHFVHRLDEIGSDETRALAALQSED